MYKNNAPEGVILYVKYVFMHFVPPRLLLKDVDRLAWALHMVGLTGEALHKFG